MATEQEALKIYLPPDEAEKLREIARLEERSVTGLVRLAIRSYLAEREVTA